MYTAPVAAGCSLHTTEEPFDCAAALQNWHVAFGLSGVVQEGSTEDSEGFCFAKS